MVVGGLAYIYFYIYRIYTSAVAQFPLELVVLEGPAFAAKTKAKRSKATADNTASAEPRLMRGISFQVKNLEHMTIYDIEKKMSRRDTPNSVQHNKCTTHARACNREHTCKGTHLRANTCECTQVSTHTSAHKYETAI